MVVLLVIGILLAIAIPTFLGTTSAADDRSAQSNLNTALTDANTQFETNGQTYFIGGVQDSAAFAAALTAAQLSLSFKAGSAGTVDHPGKLGVLSSISVAVSADGNGLVLAAYSVPGNCFYVVDNAQALSGATASVAPYAGTTAVTTTPTSPAPAGTDRRSRRRRALSYVDGEGRHHQDRLQRLLAEDQWVAGHHPVYQTNGFPS